MNYNNTDTISYFTNASSSDCRAFASDIGIYGLQAAVTSRFTCTTRFSNSLADVFAIEVTKAIGALNLLANAKDSGYTIDYSGANILDLNSGGAAHPTAGTFTVHTDWVTTGPPLVICLASFWIEHKPNA